MMELFIFDSDRLAHNFMLELVCVGVVLGNPISFGQYLYLAFLKTFGASTC